jgi:murein DD-endopeptidase MepM/ murein hydrolase activator NlpD
MYIQKVRFSFIVLVLVSSILVSCAKQAPVSVVNGFQKQPSLLSDSSSREVVYNLQTEAISANQNEQEYYVHGGDKVEQISKHFGVSEKALMARNGLSMNDVLPAGEYIIIPNVDWMSPVGNDYRLTDRFKGDEPNVIESTQLSTENLTPEIVTTETIITPENKIDLMREHVLQPGENIFRLALKYRVSQFDILAANNISRPDDLKSGMIIKIPPAGEKVKGREAFEYLADKKAVTAEVPQKLKVSENKKVVIPEKPKMRTNDVLKGVKPEQIKESVITKEQQYANLVEKYGAKRSNTKGMIWPADGKLIKSFGQKGRGVNHSGINIQLPVNAPIYAAESGTVLYSDDGLAQYGNLILVKHLNGYVTAYAHNSKNLVKRRQKVAKGDLIAFAGNTGNVEKSQLHFEVRKNTQPINPLKVLPKN